jgi:modulator of FtsH protease
VEPLTALADWETFYAAEVGAAAALAGLLFVGISLNLNKILAAPFLPLRGFLALLLLVAILALSSLLLMPGLPRTIAGLGILGVGVVIFFAGSVIEWIGWRHRTPQQHRATFLFNALLLEAATIPWLVGGILVLYGAPGGYYWLAGGIILAFIKAVVDAWVLLVEINR